MTSNLLGRHATRDIIAAKPSTDFADHDIARNLDRFELAPDAFDIERCDALHFELARDAIRADGTRDRYAQTTAHIGETNLALDSAAVGIARDIAKS